MNSAPELECDSSCQKSNSIINSEVISKALQKDKNGEAKLISWNVRNFTEKGDNYVCRVCCVTVFYEIKNESFQTSYCVKLNPCLDVISMKTMFYEVFNKEGRFYFDLVPRLNNILKSAGLECIKVPRTLILEMEQDKECMFMEDLRQCGFKMHNRTKGLDVLHTALSLHELARLHASSMILHLQEPDRNLLEKYPYLENLLETSPGMRHLFDMFLGFTYGLTDVAEQLQGYEEVSTWIKKILPELYERWCRDITHNPKFVTVCHGDSWCNNMLFR